MEPPIDDIKAKPGLKKSIATERSALEKMIAICKDQLKKAENP